MKEEERRVEERRGEERRGQEERKEDSKTKRTAEEGGSRLLISHRETSESSSLVVTPVSLHRIGSTNDKARVSTFTPI